MLIVKMLWKTNVVFLPSSMTMCKKGGPALVVAFLDFLSRFFLFTLVWQILEYLSPCQHFFLPTLIILEKTFVKSQGYKSQSEKFHSRRCDDKKPSYSMSQSHKVALNASMLWAHFSSTRENSKIYRYPFDYLQDWKFWIFRSSSHCIYLVECKVKCI